MDLSISSERTAHGLVLDDRQWDELVESLGPALVCSGMRRFGLTREDAEDLVQDVFQKLLARQPRARNAEAYVRTSFYNGCIDFLRQRQRRATCRTAGHAADDPVPRTVAAISVRGAMRRISPACRDLINAYCLEEHTLSETATKTSLTVNAVWKRIDRCLTRLLQCFG